MKNPVRLKTILLLVALILFAGFIFKQDMQETVRDTLFVVVPGILINIISKYINDKTDKATENTQEKTDIWSNGYRKESGTDSKKRDLWMIGSNIFLSVMVAIIVVKLYSGGNSVIPTVTAASTEMTISTPILTPELTQTSELQPTPTPTPTPEPTPTPTPSVSLAEMLKWSNNGYSDVQDLKSSRTTEFLDKYTLVHRNYGKIRQIDVAGTTQGSIYLPYPYQSVIYYYTADGELCFILLHNDGTQADDLRFYVYNNTVVKFIDVDGEVSYTVPSEYADICDRAMSVYSMAAEVLGS